MTQGEADLILGYCKPRTCCAPRSCGMDALIERIKKDPAGSLTRAEVDLIQTHTSEPFTCYSTLFDGLSQCQECLCCGATDVCYQRCQLARILDRSLEKT